VDGQRFDAALAGAPIGGDRGLNYIGLAVAKEDVALLAGPKDAVGNVMSFFPEKVDRAQQRGIKGGMARGHDADGHRTV
jgi:hypothetical protein